MEHNEKALRLNLDLLDEKREQVLKHTEDYQRKTAMYYNKKVKPRSYKPGDLVLKKLLPARKNPAHGKLGPNLRAPTSYLASSDLAITNSRQRREKFCIMLGMLNTLSIFISRPRFVIKYYQFSDDELCVY